jgi:hypothetical protein
LRNIETGSRKSRHAFADSIKCEITNCYDMSPERKKRKKKAVVAKAQQFPLRREFNEIYQERNSFFSKKSRRNSEFHGWMSAKKSSTLKRL